MEPDAADCTATAVIGRILKVIAPPSMIILYVLSVLGVPELPVNPDGKVMVIDVALEDVKLTPDTAFSKLSPYATDTEEEDEKLVPIPVTVN